MSNEMVETIKVGDIEVTLDRSLMHFNEANINQYLQHAAPYCDYINAKLADFKSAHEKMYSARFVEYKSEGGSDKYVEARCKSDKDLSDLSHAIMVLENHLKAWKQNHENATSFGHNMRREQEKLGTDTVCSDPKMDKRVQEILEATSNRKN